MITGPRYKICKRLGNGVYDKCQTAKFTLSEGRRKQGAFKRPKQLSDYGKQLLEKQRVRFTYGITEKQLTKYVKASTSKKDAEATVELLSTLERRLDNVVYRMGLTNSRRGARQMVVHGHIEVNGKKAAIPSHILKNDDIITVRDRSKKSPLFENLAEKLAERKLPTWLTFNMKKMEGVIKSDPNKDNTETMFDLGVVMEFYSR